jgi:hypothetical protein
LILKRREELDNHVSRMREDRLLRAARGNIPNGRRRPKHKKHWADSFPSRNRLSNTKQNKTKSGALVRQRTIPTERPPLVGEANFSAQRVSRGQRNESPTVVNFGFLDLSRYFPFKQLLNYPHEAEWTPFQTHYSQKIWQRLESNPGPLDL